MYTKVIQNKIARTRKTICMYHARGTPPRPGSRCRSMAEITDLPVPPSPVNQNNVLDGSSNQHTTAGRIHSRVAFMSWLDFSAISAEWSRGFTTLPSSPSRSFTLNEGGLSAHTCAVKTNRSSRLVLGLLGFDACIPGG